MIRVLKRSLVLWASYFKTGTFRLQIASALGILLLALGYTEVRRGSGATSAIMARVAALFHNGGRTMWPILAILLVLVGIAVESAIDSTARRSEERRLMRLIDAQLKRHDLAAALRTCQVIDTPVSRILAAGLRIADVSQSSVKAAMDEEAVREMPRLDTRTRVITVMGTVATLFGLVSTVLGLVKTYAAVAGSDPATRATALAEGISQSLTYTAFGMGVGVASAVAHSLLAFRSKQLREEVSEGTARVREVLLQFQPRAEQS